MKSSLAVFASLLLLAGCSAQLKVKVNVANAEQVRSLAADQARGVECLVLYAKTDRQMETEFGVQIEVLGEELRKLQSVLVTRAASLDAASRGMLTSIAGSLPVARAELEVETRYAEFTERSRTLRRELRELAAGEVCDLADVRVAAVVSKHRALMDEYTDSLVDMITDVRSLIQSHSRSLASDASTADGDGPGDSGSGAAAAAIGPATTAAIAAADAGAAQATASIERVRAACKTIICDGGLGSSGFAHAVASLPDEQWQALFNKAVASGENGNVDIVIKMNEQADFTVKGMRFDVSRIPEMARKATTQGLLLAAQLAGVPIRAPPPSAAENTGAAPASVELSGVLAKQAQRDAMLSQRRAALIGLGILVSSSSAEITSDTGRAQLAAALQAQVTALDPLIRLTSYPP